MRRQALREAGREDLVINNLLALSCFAVFMISSASCSQEASTGNDLIAAIMDQNLSKVQSIVHANPVLVDFRDRNGCIPLHIAACKRNLDIVKFLVERGSDVNAKNDFTGISSLHSALWGNSSRQDVVRFLVGHGADVNAQDITGNTPLYIAAWNGNLAVVKFLIINGADIEAMNTSGESALTRAFRLHRPQVVAYLFKKHASVSSLVIACPLFQGIPEEVLKRRIDGLVAHLESAGLPTDVAKFLVQYVTEK